VVGRAREILANLESGELDEAGRPRVAHRLAKAPSEQLAFFVREAGPVLSAAEQAVLEEIQSAPLDALTPLEALNLLARWKQAIEGRKVAESCAEKLADDTPA